MQAGESHSFAGKCALVTGGSGDIGRAICTHLARAGARVAFTYFSDREGADRTVAAVERVGGEPVVLRGNFSRAESVAATIAGIRENFDKIDIFVSNAASGVIRPVTELVERHWQWTLDINARALFSITKGLLAEPALLGRGGRIVAISSLGAARAIPQYAVVGASKAALESLARHLALDLGPEGITVNVVSPGIVDSKALKHFPNRETLLDVAARRTPIGRLTGPEDVAEVVGFLCTEAAGMIHGQTIHVDGGYSIVA